MIQTAIWICPSLCGCQIQLTADWTNESVIKEGPSWVSYRHPITGSVTAISIAAVCSQHGGNVNPPIDESVFMDLKGKQARGYLKYPIANPTDAECLYSYLWRFGGNSHLPDTCDCRAYFYFDRINAPDPVYKDHPIHSQVCLIHNGDIDHAQMLVDHQMVNKIKDYIAANFPPMTSPAYAITLTNIGTVSIKVPDLDPTQQAALLQSIPSIIGKLVKVVLG